MFAGGTLSELDKQRKYVIKLYERGAPCPACGKIQTPWEALKVTPEEWFEHTARMYRCLECDTELRQDVYFDGSWGWANKNGPEPHR